MARKAEQKQPFDAALEESIRAYRFGGTVDQIVGWASRELGTDKYDNKMEERIQVMRTKGKLRPAVGVDQATHEPYLKPSAEDGTRVVTIARRLKNKLKENK